MTLPTRWDPESWIRLGLHEHIARRFWEETSATPWALASEEDRAKFVTGIRTLLIEGVIQPMIRPPGEMIKALHQAMLS